MFTDPQPFKTRMYFVITAVSNAFDDGRWVEVKLKMERDQAYAGAFYVRVPAVFAHDFNVGDCFSAKFTRIE